MTDKAAPPTVSSKAAIKDLNGNDVLLGRGPGLSQFEGNLKFRALVDGRKEEYTATTNRKQKRKIAKEIVDLVHSNGGRFLKQEGGAVDYNDVWHEADLDTSMEKTKQALREQRDPFSASVLASYSTQDHAGASSAQNSFSGRSSSDSVGGVSEAKTSMPASLTSPLTLHNSGSLALDTQAKASGDFSGLRGGVDAVEAPASLPGTLGASIASSNLPSVSPPFLAEHFLPSGLDPRLLLFRQAPFLLQQQAQMPQPMEPGAAVPPPPLLPSGTLPPEVQRDVPHLMSINIAAAIAHQRYLIDNAMYSMLRDFALLQTQSDAATVQDQTAKKRALEEKLSESLVVRQEKDGLNVTQVAKASALKDAPAEQERSSHTEDEEVAAFLLSSMSIIDRPVMTEQEEEIERAALTQQERASILSDAYGDMCNVSLRQSKKPRRDLDENSIAFLVRQMVLEIERIPDDKKSALVEALSKGRTEKFSGKRLEKFLRCEGMNAKLAALRFVNYWESRRQVFGPEKFLLPMTLSGALRDDLVALDNCVYTLLRNDVSGRQVLYMEPHRHTREGYTSDSMLRAIWYVGEVASQENNDISSGIVQVCWFKNASIFDYDLLIFDRWAFFLNNCWPIKVIANHLCCPSKIVLRIVIPIVHTFVSKEFRARTLAHDVPDSEILQVLSKYGISKAMLPTEMGGSLQNHQLEWLANRRAAELEEI